MSGRCCQWTNHLHLSIRQGGGSGLKASRGIWATRFPVCSTRNVVSCVCRVLSQVRASSPPLLLFPLLIEPSLVIVFSSLSVFFKPSCCSCSVVKESKKCKAIQELLNVQQEHLVPATGRFIIYIQSQNGTKHAYGAENKTKFWPSSKLFFYGLLK